MRPFWMPAGADPSLERPDLWSRLAPLLTQDEPDWQTMADPERERIAQMPQPQPITGWRAAAMGAMGSLQDVLASRRGRPSGALHSALDTIQQSHAQQQKARTEQWEAQRDLDREMMQQQAQFRRARLAETGDLARTAMTRESVEGVASGQADLRRELATNATDLRRELAEKTLGMREEISRLLETGRMGRADQATDLAEQRIALLRQQVDDVQQRFEDTQTRLREMEAQRQQEAQQNRVMRAAIAYTQKRGRLPKLTDKDWIAFLQQFEQPPTDRLGDAFKALRGGP